MTISTRPDLKQWIDLARESDPEIGAIHDAYIMSYERGWQADVGEAETALFLASARTIVIDLVKYVVQLETAINTVLDDDETGAGGWGPDVTMAEVLRKAIGRE